MKKKPVEEIFFELLEANKELAYALLVKKFSGIIYNASLNQVYNKEDAEDLTQEVFMAVYTSMDQFEAKSKLSTWMYSILLNKAHEFHRKNNRLKRKGQHVELEKDERHLTYDGVINFDHPGVILENKEKAGVLFSAIHQLPENQRDAYLLNKIDGLSYQEVAAIMNLSLSSVESLLFRAKTNLRKLLKDYYEKNMR